MTHLITEPQLTAAMAADVAGIGSAISEAHAAAAGRITSLMPAAADDVSSATAALFGTYAQEYRAIINEAASFHGLFARALVAAGSAYTQAEAANSSAVSGALSALTAPVKSLPVTATALVMGSSEMPIPDLTYVRDVVAKYIGPNLPGIELNPQALDTPSGLYPLFGPKDLTLDASVSRGLTILDNTIQQQLAAGNPVTVLGYSQSAIVSSLEMMKLNPVGAPSSLPISFTLLGDPMNPNGGVLERLAGLALPSLGVTGYGATAGNAFPANVYTVEYDGYADFPRYPLNVLSDVNALAGIIYLHDTYPDLTAAQLGSAITLQTQGPTLTTYHMIPTTNLPILQGLRGIPVVGQPLADLIQPDLKVLVNLGYGDPAHGYSTAPANVPTPLGLFPHLSQASIVSDLLTGSRQGITAAASDLSAAGFPSVSGLSSMSPTSLLSGMSHALTSISSPSAPALLSPASIDSFIGQLQAANTNIANGFTNAFGSAYSALLPTADLANALLTSMPSYDFSLFMSGIEDAVDGNLLGGLQYALFAPLAADTALALLGGGWELIVVVNAIVLGLGGQLSA